MSTSMKHGVKKFGFQNFNCMNVTTSCMQKLERVLDLMCKNWSVCGIIEISLVLEIDVSSFSESQLDSWLFLFCS